MIFTFEKYICCELLLLVAVLCTSQTVIYSISFAADLHDPQQYYRVSYSNGAQYIQSICHSYVTEPAMHQDKLNWAGKNNVFDVTQL